MIYTSELDLGHSIEIENSGGQTRISLSSRSANSQQQQSQNFSTGEWTSTPTLHRDAQGFLLRVATTAGTRAIRIGAGGISLLDAAPEPQGDEMPLRQASQHAEPMQPMQPIAPMKMGDMEMKPGEMRMGSMKMSLHGSEPAPSEAPQVLAAEEPRRGRFCTQCGEEAQAEDRFCHACGSRLRAA